MVSSSSVGSMNITIPPAALEAGARTLCNEQRLFWHGLRSEAQDIIRREARAVFIAMLEAWEGMKHDSPSGGGVSQEPLQPSRIILPLPAEASDE